MGKTAPNVEVEINGNVRLHEEPGLGFGFRGFNFLLKALKARKGIVSQSRYTLSQTFAGFGCTVPGHQGSLAGPGFFQFGFELA